jgi:hypothetical protein
MARRSSSQPPHDYKQDVVNPVYLEAEERVLAWLLAQGKPVTDCRDEHSYHDFRVGDSLNLDVKCDTKAFVTGRVAWEQGVARHNGQVYPGWGLHEGLHIVVYVMLPPEGKREGKWPLLVCSAKQLRRFVEANRESPVCIGFMSQGTDRDGFGFLLNVQALEEFGAIVERGEC